MRVFRGWTQYGEDTVGIYTTRKRAEQEVAKFCTIVISHRHNDQDRCGVTSYPLDETVLDPNNQSRT